MIVVSSGDWVTHPLPQLPSSQHIGLFSFQGIQAISSISANLLKSISRIAALNQTCLIVLNERPVVKFPCFCLNVSLTITCCKNHDLLTCSREKETGLLFMVISLNCIHGRVWAQTHAVKLSIIILLKCILSACILNIYCFNYFFVIFRYFCSDKSYDWWCRGEGGPRLYVSDDAWQWIQHLHSHRWCGGSRYQAGAGGCCAYDPGGNHPGQRWKKNNQNIFLQLSHRDPVIWLKQNCNLITRCENMSRLEITVYPKDI